MRILLFFFLLINIHCLADNADSTHGSYGIKIQADYGFIIAHRPALLPLQQSHVKAFEVSFLKTVDGEKNWQSLYLFPEEGINLAYFDLGSKDHLGYGITAYPYLNFPLTHNSNSRLCFRYGFGIGYIQKVFDRIDNIQNAAIGSHVNGVMHFDLNAEFYFTRHSRLEFGVAITHFSNGSTDLPNLGINIATLNAAYVFHSGKQSPLYHPEQPEINKKGQWQVFFGGFPKKVYPPLGNQYFALNGFILRQKQFTRKSKWGIGTDLFYDNSISTRILRTDPESNLTLADFREGIFAGYYLMVGKMDILFNMGYYLYTKEKEDGNIYHRIGLQYNFDKFFAGFYLKTHYARADFFEGGIGYRW